MHALGAQTHTCTHSHEYHLDTQISHTHTQVWLYTIEEKRVKLKVSVIQAGSLKAPI